MVLHSYDMFLPCGIAKFHGTEYVCCPSSQVGASAPAPSPSQEDDEDEEIENEEIDEADMAEEENRSAATKTKTCVCRCALYTAYISSSETGGYHR